MMATSPAIGAVRPGFAGGGHALGIDVGGTKIAGAVVNTATGTIAARRQIPTGAARGGAAVLQDVALMVEALAEEATTLGVAPVAIGVGVAELVSPQGMIFSDYRIKWRGLDLQQALGRSAGGLPVVVSSDVRAAALAEARFGAARQGADFYFLSIGTGVSGVLVQGGVPYAGTRGAALVIANGPTRLHCPHCGMVASHVVEDVASGPGIAQAFGPQATAEQVLAAAAGGDARAIAVIAHATHELGRVVALLVNSLDPAMVVVGGGLGSAPGAYFESLRREILAGIWEGHAHDLAILRSTIGPDAGLIGAALATLQDKRPVRRPEPHLT